MDRVHARTSRRSSGEHGGALTLFLAGVAAVVFLMLALVAVGVGAAAATVSELGPAGAGVLAVCAGSVLLVGTRDRRRAAAARRHLRRRVGRAEQLHGAWAAALRDAWAAYDDYCRVVSRMPDGPLAQRLRAGLPSLEDSLVECGEAARSGAGLDLVVKRLRALTRRNRLASLRHRDPAQQAVMRRQTAEAARCADTVARARGRLRAHVHTMQAIAVRAAEIAASSAAPDVDALVGSVDTLHTELTALNRAVAEVQGGIPQAQAG